MARLIRTPQADRARALRQPSPPFICVGLQNTGERRCWGCSHAAKRTYAALIAEDVRAGSGKRYTDEWQGYSGSQPVHAAVRRGMHGWARADGDGRREVHYNTFEGDGSCAPDIPAIVQVNYCGLGPFLISLWGGEPFWNWRRCYLLPKNELSAKMVRPVR
jgi:hypothetical protein